MNDFHDVELCHLAGAETKALTLVGDLERVKEAIETLQKTYGFLSLTQMPTQETGNRHYTFDLLGGDIALEEALQEMNVDQHHHH